MRARHVRLIQTGAKLLDQFGLAMSARAIDTMSQLPEFNASSIRVFS